jgi:hypothetical protein
MGPSGANGPRRAVGPAFRKGAIGHVTSEVMIKYTVRARGRDAVCSGCGLLFWLRF